MRSPEPDLAIDCPSSSSESNMSDTMQADQILEEIKAAKDEIDTQGSIEIDNFFLRNQIKEVKPLNISE